MESESGPTKEDVSLRAEIDTSAPFESVKEAVTRFGGVGFWKPKPSPTQHDMEEVDIAKVEEQAALLEKDLIVKERETMDVLKELETTKTIVEELKSKLQKQASQVNATLESSACDRNAASTKEEIKTDHKNLEGDESNLTGGLNICPPSAPGLILTELKQAKLNLSRTTTDLADIRGSVELLNKKLEKERVSLEKSRERLTLNSTKISSLEKELNQTSRKLLLAKDAEISGASSDYPLDISIELQRLSSEVEEFKRMGEAAKSEVLRAVSEIEVTKSRIKTAELRFVAAKKMKKAARAAEAVALAEIKALSSRDNSSGESLKKHDEVTLTFEEYSSLTCNARKAEELLKNKVINAVDQVDEANISKTKILKRVQEATEEVKTSKKALEEALNRVEAANKGKLAVEEAVRKWRSENGRKRHSGVHNSSKFKNSYPSNHRRDLRLLDVNGPNPVSNGPKPVLKQTLSIGQILSRKLFLQEEFKAGTLAAKDTVKQKVSLSQMLNKQNENGPSSQKVERESYHTQFSGKRKKFGFARFSLLLTKQSRKKKKPTPS